MHGRMTALVTLAIAMVVALPASASPQSDFDSVYRDWRGDLKIGPCNWSQAQLQNAYDVAGSNPDFQYETAFVDAIQAEMNRWRTGGCKGIQPLSVRKKSPLYGVRVVSVRGRGGAAKEVVTLRNRRGKPVSFRKASLRNLAGGRAALPAKFKLAKGRTVVVHGGCAKGKRRASFTKRAIWLCRRKQVFRDRGDVARLADAKGVVVSQRGFGSQRLRPVF
jgi:hypothetical protein